MKLLTDQVGQLTIDLRAIKRNWQHIRDKVGLSVAVSAVVKANAYGLGVSRVAPALYEQGCREFYVASLAEGLQLRGLLAGDAVIYLLAGVAAGDELFCADHSLIPVLSSLSAIESWAIFCDSQSKVLPSVIKFDSGMSRLGLALDEVQVFLSSSRLLGASGVIGFMSHLSCADESFSEANSQQLASFRAAAMLMQAQVPKIRLSLANSSGVYLSDDYHFDLVRPGAALYGINPVPEKMNPLVAVVSLKLPILQVKKLKCSSAVGYGGDAVVAAGTILAVAQGGYADGINRVLGLRRYGFIGGQRVSLVGRISMDTCIFDVSSVPELQRGDSIDLFVAGETLSDLATSKESLGYEILTSLGPRYQRVYLDDD